MSKSLRLIMEFDGVLDTYREAEWQVFDDGQFCVRLEEYLKSEKLMYDPLSKTIWEGKSVLSIDQVESLLKKYNK